MPKVYLIIAIAFLLTSCTRQYYVVRHAEKASPVPGMSNDVPLSAAGEQRALALKDLLVAKDIRHIYSTNTIRTKNTAEPLRQALSLQTIIYTPGDSGFINRLKKIKKNTLIVGHSNTVDDIVNQLCGRICIPSDLSDNEYNNLFIVRYRRFLTTKTSFKRMVYGAANP